MFSDIVAIIAMFGTFFVVYLNHKKDMAMFKLDIDMENLISCMFPFIVFTALKCFQPESLPI